MFNRKRLLLLLIATYIPLGHAFTIVYNMRIRRAFNIPPGLIKPKKIVLLSALPIYFGRRSHIVTAQPAVDVHEKRNIVGSLFNVRYIPSRNWWAEITTGLENDHSSFEGSDPFSASRTGFDDFLFSGGYRHFIGDKTQLVVYGLAGLPAGRSVRLDDRYGPLVGSRFYGAGFGTEASYAFIECEKRTLSGIIQQRFVHLFNRSWNPILSPCDILEPGNFTDILATLQYRQEVTVYEVGYNPTFFTNQGVITPAATVSTNTFVRNAGYFNVLHLIRSTIPHKPIVIGGGVNAGATKQFSAKTFSVWFDVTVVF
jgi:hypothetical protein